MWRVRLEVPGSERVTAFGGTPGAEGTRDVGEIFGGTGAAYTITVEGIGSLDLADAGAATAPLAAAGTAFTSWGDDDHQHLVYVGQDHDLHELHRPASSDPDSSPWSHTDLTRAGGGAPPAATSSGLTSWSDDHQHVVYLTDDGRVQELTNPLAGGSWAWRDVTDATGGAAPPAATDSPLTSWHEDHVQVGYLDRDHHVHELSAPKADPASVSWSHDDLTGAVRNATPSPAAGGSLTNWTGAENQHVVYITDDGHVEVLSFPGSDGSWEARDVMEADAGSPPPPADPGGALTVWDLSGSPGQVHVAYVDRDHHVQMLSAPDGQPPASVSWSHDDLTASAGGAPAAAAGSAITSWTDDDYQHVVYVSEDGDVVELFSALEGGGWEWLSLTKAPQDGAPPAATDSDLRSWTDEVGYTHVAYIDRDHHVRELYRNTGGAPSSWSWSVLDASVRAGSGGGGVRVNNEATWSYSGEGQAAISVQSDGRFTMTGGTGPEVTGRLRPLS